MDVRLQKQTFLLLCSPTKRPFCTQTMKMSNKKQRINNLLKTSKNIFQEIWWGIVGNCVTLRTN